MKCKNTQCESNDPIMYQITWIGDDPKIPNTDQAVYCKTHAIDFVFDSTEHEGVLMESGGSVLIQAVIVADHV